MSERVRSTSPAYKIVQTSYGLRGLEKEGFNVIILPGDIIAVRGTGWLSREIEEVTSSKYSHIATAISDSFMVEALWPRVHTPDMITKYTGVADVYRYTNATDAQRKQMAYYVQKQIGTHYSALLLLYEWLRYRMHIMPVYTGLKFICSLLEADAVRKGADLPFCQGIPYPSPQDVVTDPAVVKIGSL